MSFSLKTLFGIVTLLAISLVAYQKLHDKYYLEKLNRYVEIGDGCSVIELLQYGQDQDFRLSWADEVLVSAARLGDYDTLRQFSYTADFDRKLEAEQTPLMIAAANGHFNAVKFLLVENAATRLRDNTGATAIDLAEKSGHPAIAALISASEQDTWNLVLEIEAKVFALSCDAGPNQESIDELMLSENYSALADLRVQSPFDENKSEGWFQLSDRICVGIIITVEGNKFIDFHWAIDGTRISGVEYFYPP